MQIIGGAIPTNPSTKSRSSEQSLASDAIALSKAKKATDETANQKGKDSDNVTLSQHKGKTIRVKAANNKGSNTGALNPNNNGGGISDNGIDIDVPASNQGLNRSRGNQNGYNQKMLAIQMKAEEDLKALKKAKSEGIKNIARGIMETGGAVIGATAGGILGGADGDIEEALQGIASGAGLGDAAGEFSVNATASIASFTNNRIKQIESLKKEIPEIVEQLKNNSSNSGSVVRGVKQTYIDRSPIKQLEKQIGELKSYNEKAQKASKNAYTKNVDDT